MTPHHHQNRLDLQYPIAAIDFEATALTLTSYPIEVGLAIAHGPDSEIEEWSSLILPPAAWDIDAEWDPDAEKLHGIRRRDLRSGKSPGEAMQTLNRMTAGIAIVWCDGGHYDAHWLATLAAAEGVNPAFTLGDAGALFRDDPTSAERLRQHVRDGGARHRAGPDAARICEALKAILEG